MTSTPSPERSSNNLGIIRLVLAGLVIASHSVEAIDGNRSRELLTRMFGTLSFGELAVDGFFVVSGYLITRSQMTSATNASYLYKRVLRIYPGFIVAYLFCLMIVAPVAGGDVTHITPSGIALQFARILLLKEPEVVTAFPGLPYPGLNGSMWTIAYEFRCYLMVILLASFGLLKNRTLLLGLTVLLLAVFVTGFDIAMPQATLFVTGTFATSIRFAGIFCCGMLFYLYRDRIVYRSWLAIPAAIILWRLMYLEPWAEPALVLFGGYILFWFAFNVHLGRMARLTADNDISYGLYLYAWPIQNLLIWNFPGITPVPLFCVTLVSSAFFGYLSWKVVEQPFLRFKRTISTASLRHGPAMIRVD